MRIATMVLLSASCAFLPGCGLLSWPDRFILFGKEPDPLEVQYMRLAWLAQHPKACGKISDRTVTTELLNSWGTRASHLRSSCFSWLAQNSKNRFYCRHVVSVSTIFYDGSFLNRKDCEANTRGNSFVGGEVEFDRLIARMGYSRDQLNEVMVNRGV